MSDIIGARIRDARKKIGLRQEELGARVGLSRATVSEWESGRRTPDISVMEKLAAALEIDPWYLMGFSDDPSLNDIDVSDVTEEEMALYHGDMHALRVGRKHLYEDLGHPVFDLAPEEYRLLQTYRGLDDRDKHVMNILVRALSEK